MLAAGCAGITSIGVGSGGNDRIGDTVLARRDPDIGTSGEPGDDGVGALTNGWNDVVDTFVGAGIAEGADAPVDGC